MTHSEDERRVRKYSSVTVAKVLRAQCRSTVLQVKGRYFQHLDVS